MSAQESVRRPWSFHAPSILPRMVVVRLLITENPEIVF